MNRTTVLVVEDDRIQQEIFKALIPKDGFDLEIVENGCRALDVMESRIPDIVLSDLHMPEMDGRELLCSIRANPAYRHVYFIMISGSCNLDAGMEILHQGANDFLAKPIRESELAARLSVAERYVEVIRSSRNEYHNMYAEIDVLLIQDGGCAPGYNPVTAFLAKYIEEQGRRVFCALEGFKSLMASRDEDYRRLVYDPVQYRKIEHVQGVVHVPVLIDAAGANFRSDRFPEFKKPELVKKAVENVLARGVKAIVAIGGNGTFYGIRDMAAILPEHIKTYFIPVTVDSDVFGTETIGQHSGVEFGSEKIRSYMADARTHKRVYIIEMMGAKGGFHALHSCLGAHAHLAVLPGFEYDLPKVVEGINGRDATVIVVAEGYKRENNPDFQGNAAELFYENLKAVGIPIERRVVCEPFSRDIRGIPANNVDVILSMRMAWEIGNYLRDGLSKVMPAVQGEESHPIAFADISTDNTVNPKLARLANRLYS